jgi:hypothetical protein
LFHHIPGRFIIGLFSFQNEIAPKKDRMAEGNFRPFENKKGVTERYICQPMSKSTLPLLSRLALPRQCLRIDA